MALNRRYFDGFINQLEASQRGEVTYIPVPLDRVGEVFNLMPSRYTLISGATGSGKTSFTDFVYVLGPWSMLPKLQKNIHWEVNYFSLERKEMFKHAKWNSWMIYRDNADILLSADQIMGWKNGPLNAKGYQLVRSYDEEMSNLLEHVHIYDSKMSTKVISRVIERRARELGTLFYTDDVGIRMDDQLVYIERFSDKGLTEETKIGPRKYIQLTWEGKTFKLNEESHKYFMNNPLTFVFFVIDGINLLGDKDEMDAVSVELANARDIYGFSPVVVVQQNRAMGDIQRMKAHGSDLSPQLEDIFKTSQMGFDADLVIGLFDAYRYKSWDKEGKYGGYVIKSMDVGQNTPSTQTPLGISRFRSMHILKNTFGADGGKFGLKFLGECNHFETLPYPDTIEMDKVYMDIRKGI